MRPKASDMLKRISEELAKAKARKVRLDRQKGETAGYVCAVGRGRDERDAKTKAG